MSQTRYEKWTEIDWTVVQSIVWCLQKRIYKASQKSERKKVHNLQRLLINSFLAKLLAVKKVSELDKHQTTTAINQVQELTMTEKWELANTLCLNDQSQSVRTIWKDRAKKAKQMLITMALEPQWEAKFAENSYSFHLGKSCHEAMSTIFEQIDNSHQFCLNTHIKGCFENIDQSQLLDKVGTFPTIRRQLKSWFKTGVFQGNLFINQNSTPDKAILSPLLANIALNGMENFINHKIVEEFSNQATIAGKQTTGQEPKIITCVVRYGDNLIILNQEQNTLYRAKKLVREWLGNIGIKIDEAKTKIVDLYQGFDFLGWNFKIYSVGRHQAQNSLHHSKLLIKPSKKSIAQHYQEIKSIFRKSTHLNVNQLITKVNRKIKSWAEYHQFVMSSQVFRSLDNLVYKLQWQWAKRKHPDKGIKELKKMYFTSVRGTWRLSFQENGQRQSLYAYRNQAISRYVKKRRQEAAVRTRGILNPQGNSHQERGQKFLCLKETCNFTKPLLP